MSTVKLRGAADRNDFRRLSGGSGFANLLRALRDSKIDTSRCQKPERERGQVSLEILAMDDCPP